MFPSRFLTQEDLFSEKALTITGVVEKDLSFGGDPSFSWVMTFEEMKKPLILNYPLALIATKVLGSVRTEDWIGGRVCLYWDPYVYYSGRLTGAIRLRAAQDRARKSTSIGPNRKKGTRK